MSDAQPTEVLSGEAQPRARSPRRVLRRLLWVLGPVVLIVALFVVVDTSVRAYAEGRIASEIEKSLPVDVSGDVAVHVGGASVIQQYLSGTFSRVELDAPKLSVKGSPLSASVVATGVPADFRSPVSTVEGTLSISQDSLNKLVQIPGTTGDITLGSGTIGYDGTIDVLGLPIGYTVTAKPEAAGSTVLLQPVGASVTAGAGAIDLSNLVQSLTDRGLFTVCAAQYLPKGVGVTNITVVPSRATVHLAAHDFVLDEATLNSKGSCTPS